ncbi:glycosyltransferase involved in cell wall biosynthesis [Sphingobium sp. B2D3A]|uniref:glycosyltransferase family 4 protein n=1 Tax=unclassified Sphingobium TaxID=2611147 RepID=UPI0022241A59|nr:MULTISPECIES: glycosyltransferase family 1 protein [unclassified Sphingobium]MCW2338496.1 glycosyltransferase involved in cell wall biosynthesis [Sphingobium sp. B2D3A]MCW2384954.1 glycosyltransferase involved in cell wall biosynthesis [Sphingobium sp. B2D3D]
MAYAAHFQGRSQAVVQWGGLTRVLTAKATEQLYGCLIEQGKGDVRGRLLSMLPASLIGARDAALAGRLYLNVGHTGLDKAVHASWLHRTQVRPIYFVHDLIPIRFPEYCRPGEAEKHRRRLQALLSHGVGIIGNSRHTLDEVTRFATQQSLSTPPSLLAPLGLADPQCPSAADVPAQRRARPYFVVLGTIEARKNHLLLLTLWAELARRFGSACPQLVIIGQRGWECEQVIDMLDRCEAIREHVVELPSCDDTTLAACMRGARALLFPSFAEGYGLPLVEALAAGTPVIASDLPVFRELAGSIPDYLSPIDGIGWMNAVEDYGSPASFRRSAQLERLRGWEPPSWSDHFNKVDEWLNQISQMPVSGLVSAN